MIGKLVDDLPTSVITSVVSIRAASRHHQLNTNLPGPGQTSHNRADCLLVDFTISCSVIDLHQVQQLSRHLKQPDISNWREKITRPIASSHWAAVMQACESFCKVLPLSSHYSPLTIYDIIFTFILFAAWTSPTGICRRARHVSSSENTTTIIVIIPASSSTDQTTDERSSGF